MCTLIHKALDLRPLPWEKQAERLAAGGLIAVLLERYANELVLANCSLTYWAIRDLESVSRESYVFRIGSPFPSVLDVQSGRNVAIEVHYYGELLKQVCIATEHATKLASVP